MPDLSVIAVALGAVLFSVHAAGLFFGETVRRAVVAFPRNVWAARILTAIDLLWATWLVYQAPLEWFDNFKPLLTIAAPVLFFLIVVFMDELLGARALGGLLLLVPTPMLDAERWHPSEARLVIAVLAYVFVIAGSILIVSPYRFRKWYAWWAARDARWSTGALLGAALGLTLILLGTTVYRP